MAWYLYSFLVITLLGIADAGYLVWNHYRKKPLVCPIGHHCGTVTEGDYAKIFLIRNDVAGLLYYVGMGVLAAVMLWYPLPYVNYLALLGAGVGVLFSGYLTYLQVAKIKNYCTYCIFSAVLTVFLLVNGLFLI